jgi:hypothetical protein
MFRRYIAFLLIFALTAASFQRFFAYAGFELNRNYIAENLCINKTRPWLNCNGKCYYTKTTKEAQQRETTNDRDAQKSLFSEIYLPSEFTVLFHTQVLRSINTPYRRPLSAQPAAELFRPPRCLS